VHVQVMPLGVRSIENTGPPVVMLARLSPRASKGTLHPGVGGYRLGLRRLSGWFMQALGLLVWRSTERLGGIPTW
jgi:hypothetical protein